MDTKTQPSSANHHVSVSRILTQKLFVFLITVAAISVIIFVLDYGFDAKQKEQTVLNNLVDIYATNLSLPLYRLDEKVINNLGTSLMALPSVKSIRIYESLEDKDIFFEERYSPALLLPNILQIKAPIRRSIESPSNTIGSIGHIEVTFDNAYLQSIIQRRVIVLAFILGLILATFLTISFLVSRNLIVLPITSLANKAKVINKDPEVLADLDFQAAELNTLSSALYEMAVKQKHYSENLESLAEERSEALFKAEHELMESERLASLGRLVAGVAHEINTPLGNARLISSDLHSEVGKIESDISNGSLTREGLDDFVYSVRKKSDVMERNLARSGELIKNFKQVAVDQTSEQRRPFELNEQIQSVVSTLSGTLKQAQATVTIEPCPRIDMDSYPGPLGQVVTNIIQNACVHAFDHGEGGEITIKTHQDSEDECLITITDNGKGMTEEVLANIFEPFYTTKTNAGGTGLGLSITANIVNTVLLGKIDVSSTLGQGTRFDVRLKCRAE